MTVVGPGGVGKTRVALEVARRSDAADRAAARPGHRPGRDPARAGRGAGPGRRPGRRPGGLRRRCSATGPACWWSTTASTCSTRRATSVERSCCRPARGCPCWRPAASRSALAAEYVFRLAPLALPASPSRTRRSPRRSRCSSTGPAASAPARAHAGGPRTGRRHRPPPRRHAAGHRARRRPAVHLLARRPAPPARPRARPARRPARRRRPAPDAARHRRVVLPAARRRRAAAVPVPVGLRRRDRPRRRRAARHRPGPGRRPRHRAVPAGRRLDARRRVRRADGTRYRMLETLRAFGLDRLAAEGEDRRRRRPPAAAGRST